MSLISRNLITHSGIEQYTTSRNYKQDGYNDQYICPIGEVSASYERWPRSRHTFTEPRQEARLRLQDGRNAESFHGGLGIGASCLKLREVVYCSIPL